jgi:hypothetical protein
MEVIQDNEFGQKNDTVVCDIVQFCRHLLTFRRNVLPAASG